MEIQRIPDGNQGSSQNVTEPVDSPEEKEAKERMEQLLEERNELGVKYKAFNDMDTAAEEQRENDEGLGIEEEDHEEAIEKTKAVLKEAMRELKSKDYELQEAVANYERVTGRPAPYDATDEFYDKVN
jgi:uncharacterized protein (DUF488 family)